MQSQIRALTQDAQKVVKSKLTELGPGTVFAEVHDDALHGLATAIASSEVCVIACSLELMGEWI